MEINEFIETTSRLEQYFDKEYSNEQRQIMYEELKNMPVEKYKELVDECLKKCKYLPKLADILPKKERYSNFESRDYSDFDFNSLIKNREFIEE